MNGSTRDRRPSHPSTVPFCRTGHAHRRLIPPAGGDSIAESSSDRPVVSLNLLMKLCLELLDAGCVPGVLHDGASGFMADLKNQLDLVGYIRQLHQLDSSSGVFLPALKSFWICCRFWRATDSS
ncbi:unnamed protein product [Nesidiocoris tenuis]|uniref:Uncharacterized protein n=1 Tax=Nesidiocoris tenuis TaxID=355587 RepID=A0A6H5GGQ9_9HEMI|nr:unnamed protein product [Nesidiocoris tenuis]